MVINVQAFNATGKDARRIYEELDDFQTRRPIDVIAANRPILILDEALSAVDAENEALIQQALDHLMQGRTTLILAHRLSSVIGADRILVLEAGKVVAFTVTELAGDEVVASGNHPLAGKTLRVAANLCYEGKSISWLYAEGPAPKALTDDNFRKLTDQIVIGLFPNQIRQN
jgi:ABC-type multidrug transport system ATPase subunit